jgi:pyridoxine 4-dehydrogenase
MMTQTLQGTGLPIPRSLSGPEPVHDNLRNLSVGVLDVVDLSSMLRNDTPAEDSLEEPLIMMADLQRQG